MHTITQSVQAELAARETSQRTTECIIDGQGPLLYVQLSRAFGVRTLWSLRRVEFPAGQTVGGPTSPAVMKEISEPRGCVCGVLPEHGPATTRHTDHIITDHMGSRRYGICPWHSCR